MSEDFMKVRGRHATEFDGAANGAGLDGGAPTDVLDIVPFTEDIDLADDPFADDLSDQLAARAPRRYATRTTAVLAGLVLLVGGFLAGAQVQKNFGTPAGGSSAGGTGANAAANAFAGGGFAGRNAGGGGQTGGQTGGTTAGGGQTGGTTAAAVTTGTVKLVDGTTVYVQTADGNVVTVKTNGSTAVQIAQSGTLTDLSAGATVSIEGSAAGDGTVTATKVTKAR